MLYRSVQWSSAGELMNCPEESQRESFASVCGPFWRREVHRGYELVQRYLCEMEGMHQCLRLVVMMCTDWYPSLAVNACFHAVALNPLPGIHPLIPL